jgi:GntR family transcriptional regulator
MSQPTDSRAPRYVAIAAELRERIAERQLAPHTLLPSERELSESHGVSRMTARHALALLEREGFVYRRPPRGTFVAEPRVPFHIGSFSDEVSRAGRTATASLLWAKEIEASRAAQEALGLPLNARVNALHRLRLADGEPLALETTYFPTELTPGLLQADLSGSIWEMLRQSYGVHPVRAQASIESVVLDDASCAHLGVRAATSGLLLTRRTYGADGRCIEYARDLYRADRTKFEVETQLASDHAAYLGS